MCRSIKTLFNFDPPASNEEIRASALQFVRKLSGFTKPSKANEAVFNQAVEEVAAAASNLLGSLVTTAQPHDREIETQRARARTALRYGDGGLLRSGPRGSSIGEGYEVTINPQQS